MKTTKEIKSGSKVVTDFIASQKKNNTVDADTLKAVTELHATGKLTKTKLLQALEKNRNSSS